MLQRAEVSGRAHALMAALRLVGEERHIMSPRLFDGHRVGVPELNRAEMSFGYTFHFSKDKT
eukprot:15451141-Alexandrium_andersonii.AAC.1